jgi:putative membrane-bound dehydrogenase-like protein
MRFQIPTTTAILWLVIPLLWQGCSPQVSQRPDNQPRKIEVLFLGHDSEHHNSAAYLPILASALARKGINFTYTDSLGALHPTILAKYDALMVYANHDSIGPAQADALLEYVAEGHGFLPIHCASWCFRNEEKVVELIGGQFLSHGTGVFQAEVISKQADHPVLQDFTPFESWDETYVHSHHHPDRTILMERVEGEQREPWTWVRTHGKGRVFYTASGHDERTWRQPQFHKLLENAIVWAVGERVKGLWEQYPAIPEPAYSEAKIPNYEQRDPPPRLQEPLSAEASQLLTQIPPGFQLELFAEEPDVINPISMAWDETGRLWVIETVDYPNTVREEDGLGDDRIKILEDTDGDGKADRITVFAENLNIPTSMVFANGGLIVAQAPHFLFLKDTDGDDVADVREVLLTGWGTFDTHAGPSNLQYGFDNRIWGAVGYSGFEGEIDGEEFRFRQGFYRFLPAGTDFEFMTRTSNNTWGLGFSEDFQVFGSTANNTHSVHLAIPDRYFEGIQGLPGYGSQKIDGHYSFHPITQNVRQVDVFNGFTAAAGHHLYTARQFPERYWNQVAFVCAPTGRLIHEAILQPRGSGFVEQDGWNIMASHDEWFGPVEAKVGPDGSLWVADWYNFIIQHNPTPPGFENGPGNAHINPLRDRTHGRIYRLTYQDGPAYTPIQLSPADPDQLVATLAHDNLFWRMTAQRLLVERGQTDVGEALVRLVSRAKTDAIGLKPAALHAIWTLQGLDALNDPQSPAFQAVVSALEDPTPAIRRASIQVLADQPDGLSAIAQAQLIRDPDPQVQLAALLAISDLPPSDELGKELYALSKAPTTVADRWLAQAVYLAAAQHQDGFRQAWQSDPAGEALASEEAEPDWVNDPDYRSWQTGQLPAWFHENGMGEYDGAVWFKKEIEIPATEAGKSGWFSMGPADDTDSVYVNGQWIGGTHRDYQTIRKYRVPAGLLQAGKNVITIHLVDTRGWGGLHGPAEALKLTVGQQSFPLAGDWYMAKGKEIMSASSRIFTKDRSILRLLASEYFSEVLGNEASLAEAEVVLELGVIPNEMKYDQTALRVPAGAMVEIRFRNQDFMQHNLLIITPGSLEEVGAAADAMASASDAAERQYIPEIPEVLFKTPLVDPDSEYLLRFRAPTQAGEYPFVCTFPGHWRMMNGILTVTQSDEI